VRRVYGETECGPRQKGRGDDRPLRAGQRGGCVRRPDGGHTDRVGRTSIGAPPAARDRRRPATRRTVTAVGRKPARTQRSVAAVTALPLRVGAVDARPALQQLPGRERGQLELIDVGAHRGLTVAAETDGFWPERAASPCSAATWSRRSAARSSSTGWSRDPASPIRACAAVRRLSTRSEPSLSSLILTSSPGFKPSRFRKSAGRTSLPRSSSLAFPLMGNMWEILSVAHVMSQMGHAGPNRTGARS